MARLSLIMMLVCALTGAVYFLAADMTRQNPANAEALLNIFANGLEIWGMSSAGNFFGAGIVLFILRKPLLGGISMALCPISVIAGLAAPGLINWLVSAARANPTEWFPTIIVLLAFITFVLVFGMGLLPVILAFKLKHKHKWLIFLSTFIAWLLPFGWTALLYWSLRPAK